MLNLTNWWMDKQTFVIVELILWLKMCSISKSCRNIVCRKYKWGPELKVFKSEMAWIKSYLSFSNFLPICVCLATKIAQHIGIWYFVFKSRPRPGPKLDKYLRMKLPSTSTLLQKYLLVDLSHEGEYSQYSID